MGKKGRIEVEARIVGDAPNRKIAFFWQIFDEPLEPWHRDDCYVCFRSRRSFATEPAAIRAARRFAKAEGIELENAE